MAFPQPGQPSGLPQTHTNVRQHSWTPQPPPWTPWTPQRQPHTWTPQRQPPPWTPQRHPHPWTPQPPPWITHHPTPHPHDQALNRPLDAALRKIHELEDALLHQATLSRHFLYSLKSPNAVICPDCNQDIAHTCSPSGFQPPMIQREHYSSSLSSNYPVGPQTPYANPFQFTEQTYPPSDFRPVIVPPPTNSFPFPPFPGTPGNPTGHIIPPTPRETRFGEGRTPSVRFRSPVSYISPLSPSSSNLFGVFIPPSPNPLPQQLPTSGPRLTISSPSGASTPLLLNTNQRNEPIIQPVIPPLSTASPVPETSDSTDEDFISAQAREADWSITYTNDVRRPISSRRAIDVESVQSLQIGRESPIRSLKFMVLFT